MRIWMLAAGAAALAITAPALADPKGGHEGGKDKQHAQQGGGPEKAERGNRGGGDKMRGHDRVENVRVKDHGNKGRGEQANRGKGDRHDGRVVERGRDDRNDRDRVRIVDRGDRDFDRDFGDHRFARGFADGCPPGLDKKDNGCRPPGLAKKMVGTIFPDRLRDSGLIGPYRAWYRDNDRFFYRMGPDGYIYRVNRTNSLIDALIPSYLNDFSYYPVGMTYPSAYNYYNLPMQYAGYWPDSDDSYYRYGNGAIYQVDPQTSLIQGIVALLAGDLTVGQPLPVGYSAYNVPFDYRDRYADTADDWYRYNDGYIYRVDPTTQLVTAVIRALA